MENFLSLDLSLSSTGYAVFNINNKSLDLIDSGAIKTKKTDETGIRLIQIEMKLLELKNRFNPKTVIYERGFNRYSTATAQLNKVLGVMEMVFVNIQQFAISPMTVKKAITGNGKASKQVVLEKIKILYPEVYNGDYNNGDYDIGDAVAIGVTWYKSFYNKL